MLELKNEKWESFIKYWNHVLEFIKDNVDLELTQPLYRTVYHDHRDYDGDEANNIEILLSWGDNWQDDFNKSWDLTEKLVGEQIDRNIQGEDENYWFSITRVSFRPKAGNMEDFIKF